MLGERGLRGHLVEACRGVGSSSRGQALGQHRGLGRGGGQGLALRHELQGWGVGRGRVVCGQGAQRLQCRRGWEVGVHGEGRGPCEVWGVLVGLGRWQLGDGSGGWRLDVWHGQGCWWQRLLPWGLLGLR